MFFRNCFRYVIQKLVGITAEQFADSVRTGAAADL
jgi:hypothetical protein